MTTSSIKDKKDAAYRSSRLIDEQIDNLLVTFPPESPDNRWFWLAFLQTVQTSLNIVEEAITGKAKE
jgi:hypothetical protein